MKIEKISWHGIDAVLLETNVYEAIIVPSRGANMVRLYNKEKEVDILRTPTEEEVGTFLLKPQVFGVPLLFHPTVLKMEHTRMQVKNTSSLSPFRHKTIIITALLNHRILSLHVPVFRTMPWRWKQVFSRTELIMLSTLISLMILIVESDLSLPIMN